MNKKVEGIRMPVIPRQEGKTSSKGSGIKNVVGTVFASSAEEKLFELESQKCIGSNRRLVLV